MALWFLELPSTGLATVEINPTGRGKRWIIRTSSVGGSLVGVRYYGFEQQGEGQAHSGLAVIFLKGQA